MPDIAYQTLSSPLASGNTLTFPYPLGHAADSYVLDGAVLFARDLQNSYVQNVDFTLSYGELQVTMTWINANVTLPPIDGNYQPSGTAARKGVIALQLPLLSDTVKEDIGNLAPLPGGDRYFFS